jgi:hypothetical protein
MRSVATLSANIVKRPRNAFDPVVQLGHGRAEVVRRAVFAVQLLVAHAITPAGKRGNDRLHSPRAPPLSAPSDMRSGSGCF